MGEIGGRQSYKQRGGRAPKSMGGGNPENDALPKARHRGPES